MPKAAPIQLAYVLVTTLRRLPAVYPTAGILPGTEIPARKRRVEGT
jgi:hypothetical protein